MPHKRIAISDFSYADITRFWSFIESFWPNRCWVWIGAVRTKNSRDGYGIWKANGQIYQAHRVAFVLSGYDLPTELQLDHVRQRGCLTTLCCNPAHLEPVTALENQMRHYRVAIDLYSLVCRNGHAKIFGAPLCRRCEKDRLVIATAADPEKYAARKRRYNANYKARSLTSPECLVLTATLTGVSDLEKSRPM